MSTALSSSDSYNKIDNVLYEIRNNKGIPKNKYYEPWKEEILNNLKISNFIVQKSNLYVLTEAGREVIKNVSFKEYTQRIKSGIKEAEVNLQKPTKKGSLKTWFLLLIFAQVFLVLVIFGKYIY
jgi:hypothetical protein